MTYTEIVTKAVALGARRPIWTGAEPVAACWIDRAAWLIHLAECERNTNDAIREADRYSGR